MDLTQIGSPSPISPEPPRLSQEGMPSYSYRDTNISPKPPRLSQEGMHSYSYQATKGDISILQTSIYPQVELLDAPTHDLPS